MKKFLVIYHAPADSLQQMAEVPQEEQAKGMEAWMHWAQRTGDHLVEMGAPLANGQELGHDGSVENSTREVSGYSILQAESLEAAKALLEGHPHISGWNSDATIEIHETMELPGMN